jgi:hypothetical protein
VKNWRVITIRILLTSISVLVRSCYEPEDVEAVTNPVDVEALCEELMGVD